MFISFSCPFFFKLLKLFYVDFYQYLEKYPDGRSEFRSGRAERSAAKTFEKNRQNYLEDLYAKLQQEYEKEIMQTGKSICVVYEDIFESSL